MRMTAQGVPCPVSPTTFEALGQDGSKNWRSSIKVNPKAWLKKGTEEGAEEGAGMGPWVRVDEVLDALGVLHQYPHFDHLEHLMELTEEVSCWG